MVDGTTFLKLDHIVVGFDKAILGPLTFTVSKGDRIVLTGANGSGKSLLLKAIAQQVQIFSGQVWRADKLSFVLLAQESERPAIWPLSGYDWFAAMDIAPPPLDYVERLLAKRLDTLSGGQWQLLRLAAALTPPKRATNNPHLILLDEPANHLDQKIKAHTVDLIHQLPEQVALLMTGHEQSLIEACDARQVPLEQCLDAI